MEKDSNRDQKTIDKTVGGLSMKAQGKIGIRMKQKMGSMVVLI